MIRVLQKFERKELSFMLRNRNFVCYRFRSFAPLLMP